MSMAVVAHHATPHSFQAVCDSHPWFRRRGHVLPRGPIAQVEEHNANYHGRAEAKIEDR